MKREMTWINFVLAILAIIGVATAGYEWHEARHWEATSLDMMNSSIEEHKIAEDRWYEISDLKRERDRAIRKCSELSELPRPGEGP